MQVYTSIRMLLQDYHADSMWDDRSLSEAICSGSLLTGQPALCRVLRPGHEFLSSSNDPWRSSETCTDETCRGQDQNPRLLGHIVRVFIHFAPDILPSHNPLKVSKYIWVHSKQYAILLSIPPLIAFGSHYWLFSLMISVIVCSLSSTACVSVALLFVL